MMAFLDILEMINLFSLVSQYLLVCKSSVAAAFVFVQRMVTITVKKWKTAMSVFGDHGKPGVIVQGLATVVFA